ncbi:hypothetical protein Y032_0059g3066 [Ancylostoma ceylanicum]|uniref:Uncharacterized protein n=1 Tax=Ancylostoma ceylanicum TaxID=53326 RepID=A0A016U3D9_9BILA|nr:hypothetical protein Y032_0059g3066 [Ancylostoma ceylanicum]
MLTLYIPFHIVLNIVFTILITFEFALCAKQPPMEADMQLLVSSPSNHSNLVNNATNSGLRECRDAPCASRAAQERKVVMHQVHHIVRNVLRVVS